VVDLKRRSSRRRYLFYRAADRKVVAQAETVWVFVNATTGRAIPIPDDVQHAFEIVPLDEDVLVTSGVGTRAP
jgi:acyl-CoA thioester hydrolase